MLPVNAKLSPGARERLVVESVTCQSCGALAESVTVWRVVAGFVTRSANVVPFALPVTFWWWGERTGAGVVVLFDGEGGGGGGVSFVSFVSFPAAGDAGAGAPASVSASAATATSPEANSTRTTAPAAAAPARRSMVRLATAHFEVVDDKGTLQPPR